MRTCQAMGMTELNHICDDLGLVNLETDSFVMHIPSMVDRIIYRLSRENDDFWCYNIGYYLSSDKVESGVRC